MITKIQNRIREAGKMTKNRFKIAVIAIFVFQLLFPISSYSVAAASGISKKPTNNKISNDNVTSKISKPKSIMYRFGTTDVPETKIDTDNKIDLSSQVADIKPSWTNSDSDKESPTYADLSIKSMAMEVSRNLEIEYNDMMDHLSLLWQGAAAKSETIKFLRRNHLHF